jgi:GntR family transcriptional regulator
MAWDSTELESGPAPLWFQVADRLRRAIADGDFRPGEMLPSEARINERFGVSRATARASLDRLEQEGLIHRRSGKGSVVLPPKVDQPLSLMASFSEDMRRRGLKPSYETLSAAEETAPPEVQKVFRIMPQTPVLRVKRRLKADGWPIAVSESWISPAILKGRPLPSLAELDQGSLYAWLESRYGARIAQGHEFIEADIAPAEIASILGVAEGSAILIARRQAETADGQPVEFAVMRYRADRYRFEIRLVRP